MDRLGTKNKKSITVPQFLRTRVIFNLISNAIPNDRREAERENPFPSPLRRGDDGGERRPRQRLSNAGVESLGTIWTTWLTDDAQGIQKTRRRIRAAPEDGGGAAAFRGDGPGGGVGSANGRSVRRRRRFFLSSLQATLNPRTHAVVGAGGRVGRIHRRLAAFGVAGSRWRRAGRRAARSAFLSQR